MMGSYSPTLRREISLSMLEDLTYQNFENCLNQVFRLTHDGGTFEIKLIECQRLNSHGRNEGQREPFSLIFLGPKQPVLPQRMYEFDLGQLGSFDIFIVPIGPASSGMRYEAVFA